MEFDAIGSFLGTFLGAREANQRKKALDADISKATTPMEKMDAIAKHDPSSWKNPQYVQMRANMQDYQDKQDEKSLLENKRAGFDVLLGSLPAEQRPAAIRDWGAGIVPDNQYSAATNQQFQTTGNENSIQSANVANERAIQADLVNQSQAEKTATTLFGRQNQQAATQQGYSQANTRLSNSLSEGTQKRMADYNAVIANQVKAIEDAKPKPLSDAVRLKIADGLDTALNMEAFAAKAERMGFPAVGTNAGELQAELANIRSKAAYSLFGGNYTPEQFKQIEAMYPDPTENYYTSDKNKSNFRSAYKNGVKRLRSTASQYANMGTGTDTGPR